MAKYQYIINPKEAYKLLGAILSKYEKRPNNYKYTKHKLDVTLEKYDNENKWKPIAAQIFGVGERSRVLEVYDDSCISDPTVWARQPRLLLNLEKKARGNVSFVIASKVFNQIEYYLGGMHSIKAVKIIDGVTEESIIEPKKSKKVRKISLYNSTWVCWSFDYSFLHRGNFSALITESVANKRSLNKLAHSNKFSFLYFKQTGGVILINVEALLLSDYDTQIRNALKFPTSLRGGFQIFELGNIEYKISVYRHELTGEDIDRILYVGYAMCVDLHYSLYPKKFYEQRVRHLEGSNTRITEDKLTIDFSLLEETVIYGLVKPNKGQPTLLFCSKVEKIEKSISFLKKKVGTENAISILKYIKEIIEY